LGKIDAFELPGLKLWFNSSDHIPPHLHVSRRGQWEIRVFFLECTERNLVFELKWGRNGPSSTDRKLILESVLSHRAALLREWGEKVWISN
jgi:hypothetical protein